MQFFSPFVKLFVFSGRKKQLNWMLEYKVEQINYCFLGLGNIEAKISYQDEKTIRVFNSKLP